MVFVRDKGLPTATTHSPGLTVDEEPSFRVGNPFYRNQ